MRACTIGHAQAGAKVVWIGYAIEHQQQRRPFDGVQQFIERAGQRHMLGLGHYTLMTIGTTQAIQARHIGRNQAYTRGFHCLVQQSLDVRWIDLLSLERGL